MDTLTRVLFVAIVISSISWMVRNFRLRAKMMRSHPPVGYVPPSVESWRWGSPPVEVGLETRDDAGSSCVTLPPALPASQVIESIFGYLIFGGSLLGLVGTLISEGNDAPLTFRIGFFTFLMLCGWGLTFTNALVTRIDLTPDQAVILLRHGIVLYRRVVLRRNPRLELQCTVQSAMAMSRWQDAPHIYLTVTGVFPGKRLMMKCTPAQGEWIRDGLEHWARSA